MWFTEQAANKIGRITTAGAITEFPIPTAGSHPAGIVATPDSDGSLWFTEQAANKLGKISPAGAVTEYKLPTGLSAPTGITVGADHDVWFTERDGNKLGQLITEAGIAAFVARQSVAVTLSSRRSRCSWVNTRPRSFWSRRHRGGGADVTLTLRDAQNNVVATWYETVDTVQTVLKLPLPPAARHPGTYMLRIAQIKTAGHETVKVVLRPEKKELINGAVRWCRRC